MRFSEFMYQNAAKIENEKYVVSERFSDVEGKPMEWELRCLNRSDEEEIMRSCYRVNESNPNNRGVKIDDILYTGKLTAECVVYPDLYDKELQNSYGVMAPDQLLKKMLTSREYFALQRKIHLLGSKRISLGEKVAEAKKQ